MSSTLVFTALLMGVAGGPHCVAMCGAACAGVASLGQRKVASKSAFATSAADDSGALAHSGADTQRNLALFTFQAGRVLGYSLLGALAASSLQGLGWLTQQSAALRPVWSMFHVAAIALGLVLLVQARQPVWLERAARSVWLRARKLATQTTGDSQTGGLGNLIAPLVLGILWALLPCGLLYSAMLVAAMAGSAWAGVGVMASFALGTSVTMTLGPWLWLRLQRSGSQQPMAHQATAHQATAHQTVHFAGAGTAAPGRLTLWRDGQWGVRLAGAALAVSSAWALWMALAHNTAPWCVTP